MIKQVLTCWTIGGDWHHKDVKTESRSRVEVDFDRISFCKNERQKTCLTKPQHGQESLEE